MLTGVPVWIGGSVAAQAAQETFGGLGRAGLITIIVVSIVAIVAFGWIFRETGRRD